MEYLAKPLRRTLESTVVEARDVAELAATAVLKHLGVGEPKAPGHLSPDQQALRRRLRAHGRQLGDHRKPDGKQSIVHLVQETAYEHWHRMLFARFLAENHLLMHPDGVALTLDECEELAPDEGAANGWELAGRYASRMLPQIFRTDSPVLALSLAPEHQRKLERLLAGLDVETFHAADSLGWVYQFWQSKKKDEVNRSEVKIGADELPAVTQLFTEPYMVHFLLDNSLGAWWAARTLTDDDLRNASSEDELRRKASIPGVPLEYLRFIKQESGTWTPAAGTFDAWPDKLSDLKTLDPCCGSGHFLVAALLMLTPMRMAIEGLSSQAAVDAVLRENLHGLELDHRCVELAAFALASAAWKYPDAGGYRALPEMNVACSGLSVSGKKEEWIDLAGTDDNLHLAMKDLYKHFKDSPVLGSLINPRASLAEGSLFELEWEEVKSFLEKALREERDSEKSELAIVALGMSKASHLLGINYQLVFTNVPYLGRGKQERSLFEFLDQYYPLSKWDLATAFIDRCLRFNSNKGVVCVVSPQNWYFATRYKLFREKALRENGLIGCCRLGSGAFSSITGEVVKVGLSIFSDQHRANHLFLIDANESAGIDSKELALRESALSLRVREDVIDAPDHRIIFGEHINVGVQLNKLATCYQGLVTGDLNRFLAAFWEIDIDQEWSPYVNARKGDNLGLNNYIRWEQGKGDLHEYARETRERLHDMHESGNLAWGQKGIAIGRVTRQVSPYYGHHFDNSVAVITPLDQRDLDKLYAFTSSEEFIGQLQLLDQKLSLTNATILKVFFDEEKWSVPEKFPDLETNDPTQWAFHGDPCQCSSNLQVAVARLLGYRWPAELNADIELAFEQRARVKRCQDLAVLVDDDGIVCIPTLRGEKPAAERLLSLLQAAYGDEWAAQTLSQLLAESGARGKSLEWWLREKYFEQHCKLFQHRPFIWHIWDGLKDGFGALVNYHQLDRKTLETLIYTYLGDWIGLQERAVNDGTDGAQIRLTAAQDLKRRLELILEGEQPYDIFVRWKPLEQQPIGWEPDLNDGVRLNIRPFVTAEVLRHNKKPKLNIHWNKDRGKDVESAPWYQLGLEYDGKEGDRINDHHLSLAEKSNSRKN